MKNYIQLSLTILAISGLFLIPEQEVESTKHDFKVAVLDFGDIIQALDGIQVYSDSGTTLAPSNLGEKDLAAVIKTVDEIQNAAQIIAERYGISLILRETNSEDIETHRCGGPTPDEARDELSNLLNKRIVFHRSLDITNLVISKLRESRPETKIAK